MKIPKNLVPRGKQELIGSFYNPFTVPTAIFLSRFSWITPNRISVFAFLLSLLAAGSLLYHRFFFAAGFLMLHHFFDALDGKIARIKGISSGLGEWYDKVTGYPGYVIFFIVSIFTFNNFWTIVSGSVLLGFYSLSVILSHGFYSIASRSEKKVKMIKNKKWYMRIFGVTLIPPILIITTFAGVPEFTLYFFAIGYIGYFLAMVFFQYRYLKKHKG